MKALVCELPPKLDPEGSVWADLSADIKKCHADYAVLGELPFGPWLPMAQAYDSAKAAASVALHERALEGLGKLAPVVISSRPIAAGGKIANEGFALVDGSYVALHQKHYFPEGPAFYEQTWFTTERRGFDVHDLRGVPTGIQLCTEVMFNEWARRYGRLGAKILAAPRTTGTSLDKWQLGLSLASVVSGAYVLSSNRGGTEDGFTFGGCGFIYAPGGELVAATNAQEPIVAIDIDLALADQAQAEWPCNVPELA